jgi:signal transduction histidine kinase
MSFAQYCRTPSKHTLLALAIVGVLIVGYLDYITGYEVSLFLFYAVPILFSVWFIDRNCTILVVLVSAVVWWWADSMAGHPYSASWVHVWETAVRLVFFGFVGIAGSAIKSRQRSSEAWVANIQRLRELEREIVAAGDREQERTSADLNDGLCQYLAGLACFTGSLRDHLSERCRPEAKMAGELHELLRDAIVQARNIAHEIPAGRREERPVGIEE